MGVADILRHVTDRLVHYLKRELEIELGKLRDRFHEKSLVRIFIENRIYKRIEECETYEAVKTEVLAGLEPFLEQLQREVSEQDIEKLLQIQIRRISRFDLNKNREELDHILAAIEQVSLSLQNLTEHTIKYLREILRKYGKNFPRRTKITDLQEVDAREVALRNIKVGHDRKNQFIGAAVRNSNKSEDPLLCSEFDRLVLLKGDGSFKVVPVPDKLYVGPVKYLFVADRSQVYSMLYRHRKSKRHYVKRFKIDRYIMDREYRTIPKGCIVEAVYTNHGVVLRGEFKNRKKGSDDFIEVDFNQVELRSTTARGFKVYDREIESFSQIKRGSPAPNTQDTAADQNDAADTEDNKSATESPSTTARKDAGHDQAISAAASAPSKPTPGKAKPSPKKPGEQRSKNTPAKTTPPPAKTSRPVKPAREKTEKAAPKQGGKQTKAKGATPKKDKPSHKPGPSPSAPDDKPTPKLKTRQTASPPEPAQTAPKQEKGGDRKTPSGRILIDEETPFFLE